MKIKVCGMRDADNIRNIAQLDIDMMGFIFSPKSPRYVQMISSSAGIIPDYSPERLDIAIRQDGKPSYVFPKRIKRVGVFVDDMPQNIEGAYEAHLTGFVFNDDVTALRHALQQAGVHLA